MSMVIEIIYLGLRLKGSGKLFSNFYVGAPLLQVLCYSQGGGYPFGRSRPHCQALRLERIDEFMYKDEEQAKK